MIRSILVISKDDNINRMIIDNFMSSFTSVFVAQTAAQAMELIMKQAYTLIILDFFVQDMEGGTLLQIIRQLKNTPIMVFTHKTELESRIKILDLGASDCLVWPCNIGELVVRAEACMKRGLECADLKPVMIEPIGLMIDSSRRTVEINKREIVLTRREFDILFLLVSNPGTVFSKEKIYTSIWEKRFVKDDSNIMSHIGRLRKKLGWEVGKHIETVWGVGYRFVEKKHKI